MIDPSVADGRDDFKLDPESVSDSPSLIWLGDLVVFRWVNTIFASAKCSPSRAPGGTVRSYILYYSNQLKTWKRLEHGSVKRGQARGTEVQ